MSTPPSSRCICLKNYWCHKRLQQLRSWKRNTRTSSSVLLSFLWNIIPIRNTLSDPLCLFLQCQVLICLKAFLSPKVFTKTTVCIFWGRFSYKLTFFLFHVVQHHSVSKASLEDRIFLLAAWLHFREMSFLKLKKKNPSKNPSHSTQQDDVKMSKIFV